MDEAMTDGRHIARYLIIAFAMTWTCWMARAALCASGVATVDSPAVLPLFLIGGFGPTVAALVVRPDARSLHGFARFVCGGSRASIGWLLLLVVLGALSIAGNSSGLNAAIPAFAIPVVFLVATLIGGGNEELGWRGVLQPELEGRLPYPVATLVTGVIWSVWHVPFWLTPGDSHLSFPFPLFALQAVLLSFWLAGLRRRGGSVLWCAVLHGTMNTLMSAFVLQLNAPFVIGMLAITALSIWMGMAAQRDGRRA